MADNPAISNPQSAIRNPKWIDLHTHSTISDGSMTPAELVAEARRVGLAAIALTDHDTCDGVAEFLAAGRAWEIETLAGVEVSIEFHGRTVHLLGYGIKADHERLRTVLAKLVVGRNERNAQIIRKLQMFGVRIELDEVVAFARESVIARPHIAQVLVRKGVVSSFEEAFDRYLGRGQPAYCERFRLEPEAAVALVREAGGLTVLAHPSFVGLPPEAFAARLERLKQAGLAGLEAYYPDHTEEDTRRFLDLARRFDLLVTGGTDFHGTIKPGVLLGWGRGSLRVPYALYERLCEALERARQTRTV